MSMRFHKFASAYFAALLFILIVACFVNNSATAARTFDCRNPNAYRFVEGENRDVNIVVGDEVVSKIELPKESEVKNFQLDSIKKNKAGFEIKVNWGGTLYHYEVQFDFRCKANDFYLYRVTKVSLLTTNPDSGNFWDKRKSKVTRIQPNLPIAKFVMTDYL